MGIPVWASIAVAMTTPAPSRKSSLSDIQWRDYSMWTVLRGSSSYRRSLRVRRRAIAMPRSRMPYGFSRSSPPPGMLAFTASPLVNWFRPPLEAEVVLLNLFALGLPLASGLALPGAMRGRATMTMPSTDRSNLTAPEEIDLTAPPPARSRIRTPAATPFPSCPRSHAR